MSFDYLTRVRPVSAKEKLQFEALQKEDKLPPTFVQKEAILFALRELTGKNPGTSYEDWKPLLKTIEKQPVSEDLKPISKQPR